jgi:mannose-6-phosphate isomerase-like protein (cupin superfamily)
MPVFEPGSWVDPAAGWPYAAGRFALGAGARFDRHLHRDDELWLIRSGVATILLEGAKVVVRAGDIVLVPAGTEHDILAVHPEVSGFFVETGHQEGLSGHLYADPSDAAGHDVPVRALPGED